MYKTSTKVELTLINGDKLTADDAVVASVGNNAAASLKAHRDLEIGAADGKVTFVPYDKVLSAVITNTRSTATDPVDAVCQ